MSLIFNLSERVTINSIGDSITPATTLLSSSNLLRYTGISHEVDSEQPGTQRGSGTVGRRLGRIGGRKVVSKRRVKIGVKDEKWVSSCSDSGIVVKKVAKM